MAKRINYGLLAEQSQRPILLNVVSNRKHISRSNRTNRPKTLIQKMGIFYSSGFVVCEPISTKLLIFLKFVLIALAMR